MEQVEQGFNIRDFTRVAIRRKKTLFGVFGAILITALLFALFLPAIFRSTSVILIEKQEIPVDLVRSTVTSYADQRIQVISQRVMTTQNLTSVINKYNLYEKERRKYPLEVVIEKMRKAIDRQMISAEVLDPQQGRPVSATIAFQLSFVNESAAIAQKVVNEIVSLYMNENLKSRTEAAIESSTFFTQEEERLKTKVAELENALAKYKEENVNQLPENAGFLRDLIERARSEMADADRRQNEAYQRKLLLQTQLTGVSPYEEVINEMGQRVLGPGARIRSIKDQLSKARAAYGPNHPDVRRLERELAGVQGEGTQGSDTESKSKLVSARIELAALKKKYGENHPDVQAMIRTVAALEKESSSTAPEQAEESAPNNPVFVGIQSQIASTDAEISGLEANRKTLKDRIQQLESNLHLSPKAEQKYREISREYENAMAEYREITAKRMQADLSKNLEDERKGEKFTLLEPPTLPEEPFKPNRILIAILGLVAALVGGLGVVGLLEAVDDQVHGRAGVVAILGAPPLGVIPAMYGTGDVRTQNRLKWAMGLGLLTLVAGGLAAVNTMFMKLDVLWFSVLRKIGF